MSNAEECLTCGHPDHGYKSCPVCFKLAGESGVSAMIAIYPVCGGSIYSDPKPRYSRDEDDVQ